MKKNEFLNELRKRLIGLPNTDIEDRLSFYSEAIDDRIDEGKSEEEAVADLGSIDEIVNEIAKDTPLLKLVKEKVKPKRSLRAWEIVLIIVGFPLWFPLALTALVLILVAYLLVWVFVIVSYTIEGSLVGVALGGLVAFTAYLTDGTLLPLGASIMCLGAAILFVFACIGITKATFQLSKKMVIAIKKAFIKKGNN